MGEDCHDETYHDSEYDSAVDDMYYERNVDADAEYVGGIN